MSSSVPAAATAATVPAATVPAATTASAGTTTATTAQPPPSKHLVAYNGPLAQYLRSHKGLPVVVLCHDRAADLARTLDALLAARNVDKRNILVLQDGQAPDVALVAKERGLAHQSRVTARELEGGQQIAQHYGWSLTTGMAHFAPAPALIVLEDDLTPSPDFMEWFTSAGVVMESDPSLWCVSAWNDNGFRDVAVDALGVRRTIFFPGLGWLLSRQMWEQEFAAKWPSDHWDWFVRSSTIRANRECVVPEMPRVFHAGRKGTFVDESLQAQYFDRIAANQDAAVSWTSPAARARLAALPLREYQARIRALIGSALPVLDPALFSAVLREAKQKSLAVVLWYDADPDPRVESRLFAFCRYFGIWHQVLRGSHEGVHELWHRGVKLLLINVHEPRTVMSSWFTSYPHVSVYQPLLQQRGGRALDPEEFARLVDKRPDTAFRAVAGTRGESCDQACKRAGSPACSEPDLRALNECDKLKAHFPCPACQTSEGLDQPAYVVGAACLVNHAGFSCAGAHADTRRLCACEL